MNQQYSQEQNKIGSIRKKIINDKRARRDPSFSGQSREKEEKKKTCLCRSHLGTLLLRININCSAGSF